MKSSQHNIAPAREWTEPRAAPDRLIGALMRSRCELNDDQIERIAAYQRESGLRFGEAAVALHMVERKDVLEALSQQFQYPIGFTGREADPELAAAADPFGEQADAFRELRTRLLEAPAESRALAIVSPEVGDGKTYLAANLAVAFSQLAERTLLIDADIRTPRQHRLLRMNNSAGLSGVLAGFTDAAATVRSVAGLPNLYLLPAGAVPPNPLELVQGAKFRDLLRDLRKRFEHVVVDTPAAARGADGRVIAARCDASLLVARRDRSRMEPLEGLVAALDRAKVPIAGLVMNEH